MKVSPATILRLIRRTQLPEKATPAFLGVDEWAYRKRLDFKTILVDLNTNRPLELLADASATTFASWLQNNPGVEVIARDRSGTFAEGASQGVPDAIQVADRFHLMQNLRTAIGIVRLTRWRVRADSCVVPSRHENTFSALL